MRFPAWLRHCPAASVSRGYPFKTAQDRPQSVRTATKMRQTGGSVPAVSQAGVPEVCPRATHGERGDHQQRGARTRDIELLSEDDFLRMLPG
jgi:hypothetical protein